MCRLTCGCQLALAFVLGCGGGASRVIGAGDTPDETGPDTAADSLGDVSPDSASDTADNWAEDVHEADGLDEDPPGTPELLPDAEPGDPLADLAPDLIPDLGPEALDSGEGTPDTAPDTACTDGLTVCCDSALCWADSCGKIGAKITDCPLGCAADKCVVCKSDCTDRECGDDGCGGSCGNCSGGKVCKDGACACLPGAYTGCCGGGVCLYDSCGTVGDLVTECPFGCEDGQCGPCVPDPAKNTIACCGDALCWLDSCGVVGAQITACPDGCKDGKCQKCTPVCGGKQCGPDGCGGQCGECPENRTCNGSGQCVCGPSTETGCSGGNVWRLDSCGAPAQEITSCPYGCDGGKCLPCVPDCKDRFCGSDGCDGTCGSCPNGLTCQDATCNGDMVIVPAGTFWMGCPSALDPACVTQTSLPAYYIDRFEVTRGEFLRCRQAGWDPGCNDYQTPPPAADFSPDEAVLPVIGLAMVSRYCEWKGKRPCTEVEWEKAARGPDDKRVYPWGDGPLSCNFAVIPACTQTCPSGPRPLLPVGSKPQGASPYGVMDMIGNAAELLRDSGGCAGGATVKGGAAAAVTFNGPGSCSISSLWDAADYTISGDGSTFGWCKQSDLTEYMVGFRCCKDAE
ncbi:MAG: formylglycine-generating enzyme family protein [Deltaproteobacteria bacterium]|nr:formylglycine-generating enzyme family protein [Deltaproteobacteria bacterium]